MHYYDLFNALKEYADFYVCYNHAREWKSNNFLSARPIPENATFVCGYEPGIYDFAILNVDQQITNPLLGKTHVFKELFDTVQDIPKVVINHATPVYPEHLKAHGMNFNDAENECKRIIKELLGDTPMITNSHTASSESEWGWGYPIIHGMNKEEYFDLPKEPRAFTALSPAGCDKYYNRDVMDRVISIMRDEHGRTVLWAKKNVQTDKSFECYRDYLGRSLIYLDTSIRTPMNRARTEAMLSGCCVVQVNGCHDQDKFFKDRENCIIVPNNPFEIAEILEDLLENKYKECLAIGQAGKKMAQETFTRERFAQDWLKFIKEVLKIDYEKI